MALVPQQEPSKYRNAAKLSLCLVSVPYEFSLSPHAAQLRQQRADGLIQKFQCLGPARIVLLVHGTTVSTRSNGTTCRESGAPTEGSKGWSKGWPRSTPLWLGLGSPLRVLCVLAVPAAVSQPHQRKHLALEPGAPGTGSPDGLGPSSWVGQPEQTKQVKGDKVDPINTLHSPYSTRCIMYNSMCIYIYVYMHPLHYQVSKPH